VPERTRARPRAVLGLGGKPLARRRREDPRRPAAAPGALEGQRNRTGRAGPSSTSSGSPWPVPSSRRPGARLRPL